MVGEHSVRDTSRTGKDRWRLTEETLPAQVAINGVRITVAESLRFPEEGSSAQGESDPKARPKGVADGQQVNIPAPL